MREEEEDRKTKDDDEKKEGRLMRAARGDRTWEKEDGKRGEDENSRRERGR
jgi:hypothetical protein